jgi:hypothetical protein
VQFEALEDGTGTYADDVADYLEGRGTSTLRNFDLASPPERPEITQ